MYVCVSICGDFNPGQFCEVTQVRVEIGLVIGERQSYVLGALSFSGLKRGLSTYVDCECRVAIERVDKVCEKCEIRVDKLVIVFQRGE